MFWGGFLGLRSLLSASRVQFSPDKLLRGATFGPDMLDRELIEAVRLAREAGKILLEVYATEFGVEMKGAADPVTEADRRANAYITAKLRESFPDDAVIAEESANTALAGRGRCWFVDPLDGTKEFISRNGEFSVMIGLVVDGEAQLGVVYQPTEDKLYRGVVGDGPIGDGPPDRSGCRGTGRADGFRVRSLKHGDS